MIAILIKDMDSSSFNKILLLANLAINNKVNHIISTTDHLIFVGFVVEGDNAFVVARFIDLGLVSEVRL